MLAAALLWLGGSFARAIVADVDRGESDLGLVLLALAGAAALGLSAVASLRRQTPVAVAGVSGAVVLFAVWLAVAG